MVLAATVIRHRAGRAGVEAKATTSRKRERGDPTAVSTTIPVTGAAERTTVRAERTTAPVDGVRAAKDQTNGAARAAKNPRH
jgi:hypothetical protein